jgi:hypothetical protein
MYIDAQRLLSRCCNALVPSVAGSECLLLTLPHRGEQNYQKSVRGRLPNLLLTCGWHYAHRQFLETTAQLLWKQDICPPMTTFHYGYSPR